ncbi:PKD domain-containing protein [Sediminicola luteus]|nr:PKD domain-containing protein [Sediminicola luteus]
MKALRYLSLALVALVTMACEDDDTLPVLADFQFLVEEAQVTFNGTTQSASSVVWDFGDGNSSNEEDPVHIYAGAGTYTVTMTATDANGATFVETKEVVVPESLSILLTGGQAYPNGKTWRIKQTSTAGDGAGPISNDLNLFIASPDYILLGVGLGGGYEDEFTFKYDGSYSVNNIDGQSLMGLVYAMIEKQADIRAVSADPQNVPLADVVYTPVTDATWEVVEGDFTIQSALGPVPFVDKQQLILGDYIGFADKAYNVVLKSISEDSMSIAIGLHTEAAAYTLPTLFLHLTLEPK